MSEFSFATTPPAVWIPCPYEDSYKSRRGGLEPTVTDHYAWCHGCNVWAPHGPPVTEFETGCEYRCPLDVNRQCLTCDERDRSKRLAAGWLQQWPAGPVERYAEAWLIADSLAYDKEPLLQAFRARAEHELECFDGDISALLRAKPLKIVRIPNSIQISATYHWQARNGLLMAPCVINRPWGDDEPVWCVVRGKARAYMKQVRHGIRELADLPQQMALL